MRIMMKMLAGGVAILIAGCMTMGNRFDASKVDELKPGISTINDATQLLGPPRAESNYTNGSKLMQWQYVMGTPIGGRGAHVAILFDQDGKMIRVTHKSQQ